MRTERLTLRAWTAEDRALFAEMNADPVVMEHFPATLTRDESDAFVDRIEAGFEARGFGLWVVDVDGSGFAGFTGLAVPRFRVAWMTGRPEPPVEVGWRLRRDAWGHGFATEAARAALAFGFDGVGLEEIVSFTVVGNLRSQAVMRRLGMTRLAFYDHPVEDRDPLPSVAYVLGAADWRHGPRPSR
ncbi:MAG: GNAT family N-acetyltransferase [Nocardioidaceae bacterium]|nr:GNAT family N-acetyltransferase [Nocardioidaceae bacterium]NUS52915.1 GNAT family N-acetyltransferase [Nocardioidaceae bacterium]